MFEYMTAQEAAEKWNVSLRWVQRLCKGNRIEGRDFAFKFFIYAFL